MYRWVGWGGLGQWWHRLIGGWVGVNHSETTAHSDGGWVAGRERFVKHESCIYAD